MNSYPNMMPYESVVYLPRFQTQSGTTHIDLGRIVYLSGQGNYTLFHLEDGECVLTSLSLSTYALFLEKHGFMRLHKSYLLNLYYLNQCHIHQFLVLTLPSGQTLEIARRRRAALRKMTKTFKTR